MKLKKIASLMLAGIMAVSMLAGCKDAASSKPTDPEVPEVTPVVDAAAAVNAQLGDVADVVTFTNDLAAGKIMESYFDETPVTMAQWNAADLSGANKIGTIPNLDSELRNYFGVATNGWTFDWISVKGVGHDGAALEIYILDDTYYTESEALELVGKNLSELNLPEFDGASASASTKNYSYEGSIAAVNAESKSEDESMWVIAVSITRESADR